MVPGAFQRRLLLVGEGDFSFALAWARFQARAASPTSAPALLTATSLDSEADVAKKYGLANVEQLRLLGATVVHGVNATQLGACNFPYRFDDVRFNFPHAEAR
jgi:hypothetical protein